MWLLVFWVIFAGELYTKVGRSVLIVRCCVTYDRITNRYAAKASSLLGNHTTNLAENWMAVRAKFDGGKQVFRCQSSAWNTRCSGASLRFQHGPDWSPKVWQKVFGSTANPVFTREYDRRLARHASQKKYRLSEAGRNQRYVRKIGMKKLSDEGKEDYGPDAKQNEPDVNQATLNKSKEMFYNTNVKVKKTKSLLDRKRDPWLHLCSATCMERVLPDYGKDRETLSIQQYAGKYKVSVKSSGLVVHPGK